jgi:hypothetical protein
MNPCERKSELSNGLGADTKSQTKDGRRDVISTCTFYFLTLKETLDIPNKYGTFLHYDKDQRKRDLTNGDGVRTSFT